MQIIIQLVLCLLSLLCPFLFNLFDYTTNDFSYSKQREYSALVAEMVNESGKNTDKSRIVIVKFNKDDFDISSLLYQPIQYCMGPNHRATLKFDTYTHALEIVEDLKNREDVLYAELDQDIYSEDFVMNDDSGDSDYFHSWGAEKMGFGLLREYANTCGFSNVSIAVIDSGTAPHLDYSEKLILQGFDYVDGDEDATSDTYGHGTMVTGILSDCTGDLPVFFLPIRVLNGMGKGKMANLVNGIYEAVDNKVDVINISLGTTTHSEALEDAVKYAIDNNIVVVSAAGNSAADAGEYCPLHMNLPGFLVVGSSESTLHGDYRSEYSNYGMYVDIYAYGSNISCCSRSGGYSNGTGTSFAAPHISAACSMLKLLNPTTTPAQEEELLTNLCEYEYEVPNLSRLVPQNLGVDLESLTLCRGDIIRLKSYAYPNESNILIAWDSSNKDVAYFSDKNILTCVSEGKTIISGIATAFCKVEFELIVEAEDKELQISTPIIEIEKEGLADLTEISEIVFPQSLEKLGSMVLEGCSRLRTIRMPGNLKEITDDFSNNCVYTYICEANSLAYIYVLDNNYPYIVVE